MNPNHILCLKVWRIGKVSILIDKDCKKLHIKNIWRKSKQVETKNMKGTAPKYKILGSGRRVRKYMHLWNISTNYSLLLRARKEKLLMQREASLLRARPTITSKITAKKMKNKVKTWLLGRQTGEGRPQFLYRILQVEMTTTRMIFLIRTRQSLITRIGVTI